MSDLTTKYNAATWSDVDKEERTCKKDGKRLKCELNFTWLIEMVENVINVN